MATDQNEFVNAYITEVVDEVIRLTKIQMIDKTRLKLLEASVEKLNESLKVKDDEMNELRENISETIDRMNEEKKKAGESSAAELAKAVEDKEFNERILQQTRAELEIKVNQLIEKDKIIDDLNKTIRNMELPPLVPTTLSTDTQTYVQRVDPNFEPDEEWINGSMIEAVSIPLKKPRNKKKTKK